MNGKIVGSGIILVALLAGLVMYYLQVYGFYEEVDELAGPQNIILTLADGQSIPLPHEDLMGIDAASSPLRFRACFHVDPAALAGAAPYADATPLNGPKWFHCYNARGIGQDLQSGAAQAYHSQDNIHPGVDRVIAVYADGRAFAWHQLNDSAEAKKVIE